MTVFLGEVDGLGHPQILLRWADGLEPGLSRLLFQDRLLLAQHCRGSLVLALLNLLLHVVLLHQLAVDGRLQDRWVVVRRHQRRLLARDQLREWGSLALHLVSTVEPQPLARLRQHQLVLTSVPLGVWVPRSLTGLVQNISLPMNE